MANTNLVRIHREETRLGLLAETTWGDTPNTTPVIIPVEPPDLREEPIVARDSMIRGLNSKDIESRLVRRQATGSLRGILYPVEFGWLLNSIMGSETDTVPGQLQKPTAIAIGFYVHDFVSNRLPSGLSIVEDYPLSTSGADAIGLPLSSADATVTKLQRLWKGMLIKRLTISGRAGEDWVTYEAQLLGKGSIWPNTGAQVTAPATYSLYSGSSPDLMQKGFVGSDASVSINGDTTGMLLDFELTIERPDLDLAVGAAATRIPNIMRSDPLTFNARFVVEWRYAAQLRKNIYDNPAGNTLFEFGEELASPIAPTSFEDNRDTFHLRLATLEGIVTSKTPIPTTATATPVYADTLTLAPLLDGADAREGVLDFYLGKVDYSNEPVVLNRDERTLTVEFNVKGFYQTDPLFPYNRAAIIRLINKKVTPYTNMTETP